MALENLGNICRELGECTQAIDYLSLSCLIAREISYPQAEVAALGGLGNVCGCLGHYTQALHYIQQGLELAKGMKDRRDEAIALTNVPTRLDERCSHS